MSTQLAFRLLTFTPLRLTVKISVSKSVDRRLRLRSKDEWHGYRRRVVCVIPLLIGIFTSWWADRNSPTDSLRLAVASYVRLLLRKVSA